MLSQDISAGSDIRAGKDNAVMFRWQCRKIQTGYEWGDDAQWKTLLTNKTAHITCWKTQVGRRDTAKKYYRKRLLDEIVYLRINLKTSQLMLSFTTVRYSNGTLRSVQNHKLQTRHLYAPARLLEALAINSRLPGKSSLLLHFFLSLFASLIVKWKSIYQKPCIIFLVT